MYIAYTTNNCDTLIVAKTDDERFPISIDEYANSYEELESVPEFRIRGRFDDIQMAAEQDESRFQRHPRNIHEHEEYLIHLDYV